MVSYFILIWEVRQGCPLSFRWYSQLDDTVTEKPAIFTDADTKIKGVQIGDH